MSSAVGTVDVKSDDLVFKAILVAVNCGICWCRVKKKGTDARKTWKMPNIISAQ